MDAHRGLAAVFYDLGATREAEEHLREVARLDPTDGRPHRLLGLIYKDMDQAEQAGDYYREGLPPNVRGSTGQAVRMELAEVLVRLSRYDEALEYIEGKEPTPGDVGKAVALRAECFWGQGRTAEARRLVEEAMNLDLRNSEILRLRAKLYLEAKEGQE